MKEARQRAESASEQCTSLEVLHNQQDDDHNDDIDHDADKFSCHNEMKMSVLLA